jgi:hypothetical protein
MKIMFKIAQLWISNRSQMLEFRRNNVESLFRYCAWHYLYKPALEPSDSVRCNERQSAIMMVRRCMADLKPGVFDAPLSGCGA